MEENNVNVVENEQENTVENTEKFTTTEKVVGIGIIGCVGYTLYKGGRFAFRQGKRGLQYLKSKFKKDEVPEEEPEAEEATEEVAE